mmetsp:Transcript_10921/g.15630  ORF Transcript_10921/g.15630 Transcript_10921/m.15630 type:complete len:261 (+) Transcript_10921:120-902(+)|eukprot:CAMPEP_0202470758 /NCGR_PEP_ID=MMETSP1360-20130828/82502_1 /ASSEMBLY_ACC=CAM_ASM_000848 /TAXON_ID=515479 /ORGANISM="Licmophora paradoxa, Strain CCMP2313" /LENGTH=260 /DNA_ID=CAMNT_0049096573 /DNA_START=110 /DNA_END=892 /DNA_ORIENTATION=-
MPTLNDTNSNIFFQASEIEAFFPDQQSLTFGSEDIHVETRSNDRDVLVLQRGNDTQHAVRFYIITPEQDWRLNANFTWSLTMGWMKTPGIKETADQWLYWNKENNVKSQIQGFSGTELFSVDSVTLHFEAMSRYPWRKKRSILSPKFPATKIVLKDVLLGAHLSDANPELRHQPCQSNTICDIVDGLVVSESTTTGTSFPSIRSSVTLMAVAVGVLGLIVLLGFMRCLRRRPQVSKYSSIEEPAAEDESDSEEETYKDEE